MTRPVFRFAPSPNGRLHLGHAVSALLNAELARRMEGRLILRLEDIDPGRSRPELADAILDDLAWLGLRFDGPVRYQSAHLDDYRAQVSALADRGLAYRCFCSRGAIAAATRDAAPRDPDGSPLYPGTCRHLARSAIAERMAAGRPHTWRLDMARALAEAPGPYCVQTFDPARTVPGSEPGLPFPACRLGSEPLSIPLSGGRAALGRPRPMGQALAPHAWEENALTRAEPADPSLWGDAVIARRDVPTSYHLSVVMDDAAQGITHVVRGADLRAATDLHVLLQALIGAPSPRYHHHVLIRDANGEKLAKSRGSPSLADLRASGVTPAAIRRDLGFEA